MGGPWEKYQAADSSGQSSGPWTKYQAPQEAQAAPQSLGQRALSYIKEESPPILGGMLGGALGAPFGPLGSVAGATIGGMGGRAWQRVQEYASGARDPLQDTSSSIAGDIGRTGAAQGMAAGMGEVAAGMSAAWKPFAIKAGAQALRPTFGIEPRSGEAVLRDPSILNRAMTPRQRSASYEAFEGYTGLKGLGKQLEEGTLKASEVENAANFNRAMEVARKVRAGENVSPQELYTASQSASNLRMGPFENPTMQKAVKAGALNRAKSIIDDALGAIYQEYKGIRTANFESHAREAFGRILPVNKNGTANVLRPAAALAAAANGNPEALALISPAVAGLGIRGASLAAPAANAAAGIGTRAGLQSLADQYNRR